MMCTVLLGLLMLFGCKGNGSLGSGKQNQNNPSLENITIAINKAAYQPNEKVVFTLSQSVSSSDQLMVRYEHLDKVISEEPITNSTWSWTPPSNDYMGYMAEVYQKKNGKDNILATIGIDVSSSWTKFPRYGFLSDFSKLSSSKINSVMDKLNRYHIN